VLVGAQAILEHPVRLVLEPADLLHGLASEAPLGLGEIDDVVVEGELLATIADQIPGGRHEITAVCTHSAGRRPAVVGWVGTAPGTGAVPVDGIDQVGTPVPLGHRANPESFYRN